ncbi:MAG: xylulokinase [Bacillota bacterium]
MKFLLGIDIGTSGTKAVLFDEKLNIIDMHDETYPLYTIKEKHIEQQPSDWFSATTKCIKNLVDKNDVGDKIVGVGVGGQMHGLVLLDENNEVLRPSIIWCDQRTERECEEITSVIGAEKLIEITANPALTGFTLSKILWVKNNEPEIYSKIAHIMLPKDYINFKLTGKYSTDVSDASGMQLLDIKNRCFSKEILSAFDIKEEWLPKLYESEEVIGTVTDAMATATGLTSKCVLIAGAGDQAASAIGNGIVKEGIVSDNLGSSGVVFAHTDKPLIDSLGRVHTFCHAVKGKWHIMGVTQGFGVSIKWFRDNFAQDKSYKELDAEAIKLMDKASKLIFLPYLMGERTPHLDPNAKGVFFGLDTTDNINTMYKSVLEGVVFSQRDCMSVMEEMGVKATEVRVSGGTARSLIVREMLANNFKSDVTMSDSQESGCKGVAILAGVGANLFDSVEEACEEFVVFSNVTKCTNSNAYDSKYNTYKKLYNNLKELF